MKKWVLAIAMGGLIISFQNCSKSNLSGQNGSLDASTQENPKIVPAVSSLEPSKAVAIEIPNSPIVDANIEAVSSDSGDFNSYSLILDPQAGLIRAEPANGDSEFSKEFCLTAEQKKELLDLLANAHLFDAQDNSDNPELVCTMDYRFPYAKLYFENDDIPLPLGEKFSGCHIGADLEQSSSLKLKNFLGKVIMNLKSAKCSFEEVN